MQHVPQVIDYIRLELTVLAVERWTFPEMCRIDPCITLSANKLAKSAGFRRTET